MEEAEEVEGNSWSGGGGLFWDPGAPVWSPRPSVRRRGRVAEECHSALFSPLHFLCLFLADLLGCETPGVRRRVLVLPLNTLDRSERSDTAPASSRV